MPTSRRLLAPPLQPLRRAVRAPSRPPSPPKRRPASPAPAPAPAPLQASVALVTGDGLLRIFVSTPAAPTRAGARRPEFPSLHWTGRPLARCREPRVLSTSAQYIAMQCRGLAPAAGVCHLPAAAPAPLIGPPERAASHCSPGARAPPAGQRPTPQTQTQPPQQAPQTQTPPRRQPRVPEPEPPGPASGPAAKRVRRAAGRGGEEVAGGMPEDQEAPEEPFDMFQV